MSLHPLHRGAAAGLLALAAGLLGSAPTGALAQTYIGRVCFNATVTERQTGAVTPQQFVVQYEATNLGGTMYAVAGRTLFAADQPMISTGYGVIVGSELLLNMTTTQTHADGWRDTGINQTRLDLGTLAGTFYEIGHDFRVTTRETDRRFTAGRLAVTECPR